MESTGKSYLESVPLTLDKHALSSVDRPRQIAVQYIYGLPVFQAISDDHRFAIHIAVDRDSKTGDEYATYLTYGVLFRKYKNVSEMSLIHMCAKHRISSKTT